MNYYWNRIIKFWTHLLNVKISTKPAERNCWCFVYTQRFISFLLNQAVTNSLKFKWFNDMLLRWLYYWQLLYEVWQGSGSCCWGDYITDHYCLRFDRGAVHAVEVTILLTITVWGLREEWLIISRWLYDWPLLYDNDTHLT
jgi:hypothetical protein